MPRGRPAKPGWERFNVKLPEDLVSRLDAQAKAEGRTRSELLADGAEVYLRKAKRRTKRKSSP